MTVTRFFQGGIIASLLFGLMCCGLARANTCITFATSTEQLFSLAIEAEDDIWVLRWEHSVTGITVSDYFRIKDGQMLLSHSHMPRFDAGLGHIPERGRLTSDENGEYWVWDINQPLPYLAIRVGSLAVNHRILWRDEVFSLSEVASGERVMMRAQECAT